MSCTNLGMRKSWTAESPGSHRSAKVWAKKRMEYHSNC